MLRKRLIVIIIMLPVIAAFAAQGGLIFSAVIALLMSLVAWEFWRMFSKGGYLPSLAVLILGSALLTLRSYFLPPSQDYLLAFLLCAALTVHLVQYERGRDEAVLDFCVTVGGMVYWGYLGGYFIQLRQVPDGLWWLMLVLPSAWFADMGGYIGGTLFGKHPMAPRLSPKKTWEGYIGGIILGVLFTGILGAIWHMRADQITFFKGVIIGTPIALLVPLGDLGASMMKRFFHLKDSSNLIPGHGGVIDRIDTWVWAVTIGYFVVDVLSKYSI